MNADESKQTPGKPAGAGKVGFNRPAPPKPPKPPAKHAAEEARPATSAVDAAEAMPDLDQFNFMKW
ncbi:hypothetical protein [Gordonibacter pamelaeae]